MARIVIVALGLLLALVGGYVVGQQPAQRSGSLREEPIPHPILVEQRERDGGGVIHDLRAHGHDAGAVHELLGDQQKPAAPVGRYVPADGGRMLDTTDGTLYAPQGEWWAPVTKLRMGT
ncbi:MAG: hypothetical protein U0836_13970 [Pirellulales bacterium]